MKSLLDRIHKKRLDESGINMVDLMMWLVIAALLLAAAIQGIGYYQKAAFIYDMQTEVNGVAANAHAAAAINGGYMDDTVLSSVVADNNAKHNTDNITVTYGSILATAAGPVGGNDPGFELASVVTAAGSDTVYYLKASSTLVSDKYAVYFFKGTPSFTQGVSTVAKTTIDAGGTDAAIVPGGSTTTPATTAAPTATASPTATTSPTPTATATPTPTATVAPANPSIKSAADIVGFDASGALWNYGQLVTTDKGRVSISNGDTSVPTSFFVTDWNGDGIQDLVLQKTNGQLELRAGLSGGGFTTSTIGNFGWDGYDITVGKWKTTDSLPSIIAIEKSTGDLYLYANTNGAAPTSRTKFNIGWSGLVINLLDYDKDGNTDVIAKFSNGDLRLYRTDGNGTFINEARPVINTGWNIIDSMHSISGAEGPGTTGIVGRVASTGDLYYYPVGTSSFGPSRKFNFGWTGYRIAGN